MCQYSVAMHSLIHAFPVAFFHLQSGTALEA